VHREGEATVLVKALNATMHPLKFTEFSMEEPIQLTFLFQQGSIFVNVPPPKKYPLHKLLVYGERPQAMRVKAFKDLEQAAALTEYLGERDAGALSEAWVNLTGRGPGWHRREMEGLHALQKTHPEIDTSALSEIEEDRGRCRRAFHKTRQGHREDLCRWCPHPATDRTRFRFAFRGRLRNVRPALVCRRWFAGAGLPALVCRR